MDGLNWTSTSENVTRISSKISPNYTSNHSPEAPAPMPFSVFTAVMYSIVFIVGFLGNTLVIYVVVRYAKMKTVTNMYILNLALADELYILGIPFLGTNSVLSYWPYGDLFCKVCMTADAMSQFSSTFCLTVMSIDRYLAVVYPYRSAKWRKPQVAMVFNGMVWVVSFLIVLPVTIYSHVQDDFYTCNVTWPDPNETWSIAFILYTSILGFFCPLCVISLCYLVIVIKVSGQINQDSCFWLCQWKMFYVSSEVLLSWSHEAFPIHHLCFRWGLLVCVQAWLSGGGRSARWRVWWWSSCWCLFFAGCPSLLPIWSTWFISSQRTITPPQSTSCWSSSPMSTPAPIHSSTASSPTTSSRASRKCSASTNQRASAPRTRWEADRPHPR